MLSLQFWEQGCRSIVACRTLALSRWAVTVSLRRRARVRVFVDDVVPETMRVYVVQGTYKGQQTNQVTREQEVPIAVSGLWGARVVPQRLEAVQLLELCPSIPKITVKRIY